MAAWLVAPSGLDRDGFVFKVMFGGGEYRYISGALGSIDVVAGATRRQQHARLAVHPQRLHCTVFAGLDYQDHRLTPDDPSAGLRGELFRPAYGSRALVRADAVHHDCGGWRRSRPSDRATTRASPVGWRIFGRYYLGPEVQGFAAGDNYQQIPCRRSRHRHQILMVRMVRRRLAGPPTATTATAFTASSAVERTLTRSIERAAEARHRDDHGDQPSGRQAHSAS